MKEHIQYSPEQLAIRKAIKEHKSVAAAACAGSGKSSTARPLMNELIEEGIPVTSIPFQNSLYNEELAAMPGADVLNAHKRGNRLLIGRPKVEKNKLIHIAQVIDGENAVAIAELAAKLKCEAYPTVNSDAEAIADKYGIAAEYVEDAIMCLKMSDRNQEIVDFDDMLRFPVMNGIKRPVRFILVDEAQDDTPNLLEFTRLFIGPETKGLILGDPERQALQQFAGGDPACFYKLAEMLGCEMIPLTWNFRCGKKIVENANAYFPSDMKAAPNAIEGEISETTISAMPELDENSAILCEMNAPLLTYVVTALEKNQPVQFRPGKLWEKCLSVLWGLLDMRKTPLGTVAERAEERLREYSKDGVPNPDKMEAIKCVQIIENLCFALGITQVKWGGGKMPIHPIQQCLEKLSSGNTGPFAMTGHTAKGLQWDNVYHIPKMPAPKPDKPMQPWELHQWKCVGYVIRSRAKKRHVTITG